MSTQALAAGAGLNQLTGQMRTFYKRLFIENYVSNFVFGRFGSQENIPMRVGRTASWSTIDAFPVAAELAEGSDGTELDATTGALTAALKDFGSYLTYSSHLSLNAEDPVLAGFAREFGVQHARTMNAEVLAVLDAATNVSYADGAANDAALVVGNVLNAADVQAIVTDFEAADVPPLTTFVLPSGNVGTLPGEPAYIALVHPHSLFDIRSDPAWISVAKYQSFALPGEVGRTDNVRFINAGSVAPFVADAGAGTVDVYHTILLGANGYGVADMGRSVQLFASSPADVSQANPLGRRGTMGWTDEQASLIIKPAGVRKLHHAATRGAN